MSRSINAGVSGDTTSGGLSRLDWSVPDGTRLVILELGANDMLRGVAPDITEKNLDAMLAKLKERKIPVLLAGMRAAPNLGADYQPAFDAIYPRLAEKYGVALYPFFLDGVAGRLEIAAGGRHAPKRQGHRHHGRADPADARKTDRRKSGQFVMRTSTTGFPAKRTFRCGILARWPRQQTACRCRQSVIR